MNVAITIGAYAMPDFVELNILQCRKLFGEQTPILISDDKSSASPQLRALADKRDCSYLCGDRRRSHFSGDIQTLINALVFRMAGDATGGCDVILKISQRCIPVLPAFREALERAFANPVIQIALPGKPHEKQIARPQAKFYSRFGFLTDVVAIRAGALSPNDLMDTYRDRIQKPLTKHDSMVETTIGHIIASKFGNAHVIIPEWTNHQPFTPKILLRKSQSTEEEYRKLAAEHGLEGAWDVREWGMIEGKDYVAIPNQV